MFPEEALVSKRLTKVACEHATVTLVVPFGPARLGRQNFRLCGSTGRFSSSREDLLQTTGLNTFSGPQHLKLAIWWISGSHSKIAKYQTRFARS